MRHRPAGTRVEDVRIGLAAGLEEIAVGAGGHHRDTVGFLQVEDALHLAGHGRRLLDSDPPGRAVGFGAAHLHLAAHFGQVVEDAAILQKLGNDRHGVALGDGVEADLQFRVLLAQPVALRVDFQLVHADMGKDAANGLIIRHRLLMTGKTPKLEQRFDREVVAAAGAIVYLAGHADQLDDGRRHRLPFGGFLLVEAGDRRVLAPVRQLLVDQTENGLDIGFKFLCRDRQAPRHHFQVVGGALNRAGQGGFGVVLAARQQWQHDKAKQDAETHEGRALIAGKRAAL